MKLIASLRCSEGSGIPNAARRLEGEEFGPLTFRCDAGPLGRNRVGVFIGEVTHDLPADGRVRIEEPLDVCAGRGA